MFHKNKLSSAFEQCLIFVSLLAIFFFSSCNKDNEDENDEILPTSALTVTGESCDITETSAVLVCYLNLGTQQFDDLKFGTICSTDRELTLDNYDYILTSNELENVNTYKLKFNDLHYGTQYYYRSFVKSRTNIMYGKVRTFTTLVTYIDKIELSQQTLDMEAGSTRKLYPQVFPKEATDKSLIWSSSDENVAKVNSDGLVTAITDGSCTITCSSEDGSGKKATCKVNVKSYPITDIKLSSSNLTILLDDEQKITVQILPANASVKTLNWTSSNENVVLVDQKGCIKGMKEGGAVITCSSQDGSNVQASCSVTVKLPSYEPSGYKNGHGYVDLDLPSKTKWATCNIGALNPENQGKYFAWGETEPKSTFRWSNYKFWSGSTYVNGKTVVHVSKYANSFLDYGCMDWKYALEMEDDAAYVNWGKEWRMPSRKEAEELRDKNYTTWIWTTLNGQKGYRITSKTNGKHLFLPCANLKDNEKNTSSGLTKSYYWTNTLNGTTCTGAWSFFFSEESITEYYEWRYIGENIRPVVQ